MGNRIRVLRHGREVFSEEQAGDNIMVMTVDGKTTKLNGEVEIELRGTWKASPEDTEIARDPNVVVDATLSPIAKASDVPAPPPRKPSARKAAPKSKAPRKAAPRKRTTKKEPAPSVSEQKAAGKLATE